MIAATRGNQTFSLPNEVFDKIISFLDKKNIALLFTINTVWYQYLSRNDLWVKFCTRVVDNPNEHFYLKPYICDIIQKRTFKASNTSIVGLRVTEAHIISCSSKAIRIWNRIVCLNDLSNEKFEVNPTHELCPTVRRKFIGVDTIGTNLAIIENDKNIFIKDFFGNALHTWQAHKYYTLCLKVSNKSIVSSSADKTIKIWNSSGLLQKTFHAQNGVPCLEVIGETIISSDCCDNTICIWDENSDLPQQILKGHKKVITCLKATNSRIVSGSLDKTIRIWDCKDYSLLHTLEGHENGILCLEIVGNFIISGSSDKTMRIWDLYTGDLLHTYGLNSPIRCMQNWDNILICGSEDGAISIWTPERLEK